MIHCFFKNAFSINWRVLLLAGNQTLQGRSGDFSHNANSLESHRSRAL